MDPVARRFLWKLISASRSIASRGGSHRSVVLTTHAMEEAEALSSRLCIMVAGRIRALGTVQQLKSQFGGSYSLELRVRDGCAAAVCQFIDSLNWDAVKLEGSMLIIRYRVPSEGKSMSDMFEALEQAVGSDVGILLYSLSQTTLEQVFIQFAKEQYQQEGVDHVDD